MKMPFLAASAASLVLSMTCMSTAQAAFVLTIDDLSTTDIDVIVSDGQGVGFTTASGLVTTVPDSGIEAGAITFNGGVGSFVVNVVTGVSDPLIGPGQLDLNSINVSGGSGTLVVSLTDTDYPGTGPGGYPGWIPDYTASFGGTTSTTGSSVDFNFLGDYTNNEFGGTSFFDPLATSGGDFSGSDIGFVGIDVSTAYSLTILAEINHTAAGQITSFDAHLVPIPVPAAVWLFGSGLLGMIGIARRKKAA